MDVKIWLSKVRDIKLVDECPKELSCYSVKSYRIYMCGRIIYLTRKFAFKFFCVKFFWIKNSYAL